MPSLANSATGAYPTMLCWCRSSCRTMLCWCRSSCRTTYAWLYVGGHLEYSGILASKGNGAERKHAKRRQLENRVQTVVSTGTYDVASWWYTGIDQATAPELNAIFCPYNR